MIPRLDQETAYILEAVSVILGFLIFVLLVPIAISHFRRVKK